MQYNPKVDVIVSSDDTGMLEYWQLDEDVDQGFSQPKPPKVQWEFKSETDLYEFKKCKSFPTSLQFSPDYTKFVTFGFSDRQIRIFQFNTGKLLRKYDESLTAITQMQKSGVEAYTLDEMEFGRRLALDRDLERIKGGQSYTVNAVFDETGNFVIYPTLLGIKMVNIVTNKLARLIGKGETQRFMNISIYQGAPKKKNFITLVCIIW